MLVLALDLKEERKALEVAKRVEKYIEAVKVNYPIVLSCGIKIIEKLSKIKPVIADFKIADIPYTSSLIAEIAFESGAKAVICHGFVGEDVLREVLNAARSYDGKVYVVTELTNEGAKKFMAPAALKIVEMAKRVGCQGLIAPATKPEKVGEIRKIAGDMEILSPGIGAQGGAVEEVAPYVDGIIVGRSIYTAENPEEVARELKERFRKAKLS